MGRRRADPGDLTDREQAILRLYLRWEANGQLGRGWKARAQRELRWGAGEFQRNWGLLVAQGIVEDPNLEQDEPDPGLAERVEYRTRHLLVLLAKREKARISVYDLDGSGYTNPILTPVELDQALGDRMGGSTEWERAYRERVRQRDLERRKEARCAAPA
jgi:hypothetical protein